MQANFARSCLLGTLIALCFFCRNALNYERLGSVTLSPILNCRIVRFFDCGNDSLLSDMYWLAFIQYLGDRKARLTGDAVLVPQFLDTITCADPRFVEAFYFAAIFIGGELRRPNYAAHLIERGLAANEDDWRLPYIAGFNCYLFTHDEERAAFYYAKAASLKGAPNWLAGQSQLLRAQIPSMLKKADVLEGMLNATSNTTVREATREKLYAVLETIIRTAPSKKVSILVNQRLLHLRRFESVP